MHAKKKRNLTAAFSVKALSAQEPIVQACLDRFVDKLGPLSKESKGKGVDVVPWLEMVAFDILGEMAFGEGFDCVEKGRTLISSLARPLRTRLTLRNCCRASSSLDGAYPQSPF